MALSNRMKFRARLGQFKLPLYTVSQPGPEKLLQFLDLPAKLALTVGIARCSLPE